MEGHLKIMVRTAQSAHKKRTHGRLMVMVLAISIGPQTVFLIIVLMPGDFIVSRNVLDVVDGHRLLGVENGRSRCGTHCAQIWWWLKDRCAEDNAAKSCGKPLRR
jgi:hypothetical protein